MRALTFDGLRRAGVAWGSLGRRLLPGMLAAALVAAAALLIARFTGGPAMVFALIGGMALARLSGEGIWRDGITFTASPVLKFGVMLLGAGIALGDILALGAPVLALVLVAMGVLLTVGTLIGRALGLSTPYAVLTTGAVTICGASAALAISAVLPRRDGAERQTLSAIIGVTLLSTLAMVAYPLVARLAGLDETAAGVFLGATIHDVAQVMGAGFAMSPETGDTAAITKLTRVAMLPLVVLVVGYLFIAERHAVGPAAAESPPLIPPFLIGFVALMAVNSFGVIPEAAGELIRSLSKACLVMAVAALGMKTVPKELARVGRGPVIALCLQTLLLFVIGLGGAMGLQAWGVI